MRFAVNRSGAIEIIAIKFFLAIPCFCFFPTNDLMYEEDFERMESRALHLFICGDEKTSCLQDLKRGHLNESYSRRLYEFIQHNRDIPLSCRSDVCRKLTTKSERKGNYNWPVLTVGERYIQKCFYPSEDVRYAYQDCLYNGSSIQWTNYNDDDCPEPPFTEQIKKIRSNVERSNCFNAGVYFSKLNAIQKDHPMDPIFKEDYKFILDYFFMESGQCWPSGMNLDKMVEKVIHHFLDMLFGPTFRVHWQKELNYFLEIVLFLKNSFSNDQIHSDPETTPGEVEQRNDFIGQNLHLVHRIADQGCYNHTFSPEINNSVSINFTWNVREFSYVEIESILFVHFDQLRVMGVVHRSVLRMKEVVTFTTDGDDDTFRGSDSAGNASNATTSTSASILTNHVEDLEVHGSLLYFEYIPSRDSHDNKSFESYLELNATTTPLLTVHFENPDFEDSYIEEDSIYCARYPHQTNATSSNGSFLFENQNWIFDCKSELITRTTVKCECHHFGFIAVFAKHQRFYAHFGDSLKPELKIDISVFLGFPYHYELYLVGMVLRAISIAALSLTILSFAAFKKTRKGVATHILLNLCFSLICLLIVLYIAEQRSGIKRECRVYNILRYYLILVSLMWNGIEAHNMYRMLIKVFNSHMRYFVRKAAVVAWGFPCVMVIVVMLINFKAFDGVYVKCQFRCSLKPMTMYFSWLIPMSIIILHNLIVFVLVIRVLCQNTQTGVRNEQEKATVRSRLSGAFAIWVLLGVPWVLSTFGAIKTNNEENLHLFQGIIGVFFVTFVSLQGLFIFLFHCVRNRQIRGQWWNLVGRSLAAADLTKSSTVTAVWVISRRICEIYAERTGRQLARCKAEGLPSLQ